jgi:4-hydroxyphenylpyruvate dioxygenase-like putative hemolysin
MWFPLETTFIFSILERQKTAFGFGNINKYE